MPKLGLQSMNTVGWSCCSLRAMSAIRSLIQVWTRRQACDGPGVGTAKDGAEKGVEVEPFPRCVLDGAVVAVEAVDVDDGAHWVGPG